MKKKFNIPMQFKVLGMLLIACLMIVGYRDYVAPKGIELPDKDNLVSIKSVEEYEADKYRKYADSLDLIEIIDASDLTIEKLNNRYGKLIIERVIGVVEDVSTGAGRVLNADPDFYYINYSKVNGIHNGDVVASYMVYNPDSNFEDDIIYRFDYIIDCKGGK